MEPLNGELKKAETILKGHRIDLKARSEIAKKVRLLKSKKRPLRDKNAIVSLNTIFKKSKKRDLDLKRTKAQEKKVKNLTPKKYELLFVVRNFRSVESDVCKEHLKELGLTKMNTGRFISNSASNLDLLDKVFPFVYYGTPNLKNVTNLLTKRGTIFDNNELKLISNNVIVEDNFSNYGIYSLQELVDSIYNGSNNCDDILLKLGPINLSKLNIYNKFFDNTNKYGKVDINSVLVEK